LSCEAGRVSLLSDDRDVASELEQGHEPVQCPRGTGPCSRCRSARASAKARGGTLVGGASGEGNDKKAGEEAKVSNRRVHRVAAIPRVVAMHETGDQPRAASERERQRHSRRT